MSWAQLMTETKQVGFDILPDLWFFRLIIKPKYIGFDIFPDPWFLEVIELKYIVSDILPDLCLIG